MGTIITNRLISSLLTMYYMAISFYSGVLVIRSGIDNTHTSLAMAPMGGSALTMDCCVSALVSALTVYITTSIVYFVCLSGVN